MYKEKFKKFGGEYIPDVIEYLKNHIQLHPNTTISIGCDSIQKRRKTTYAITIMMYDSNINNGAHVIFFRESHAKIRNNEDRLYREAQYAHDVAEYINEGLSSFYVRGDLNDQELRRYKFHLLRCNGEYSHVQGHVEDAFVKNLTLTDNDKTTVYKLVDIHIDFNPVEGKIDKKGFAKNKSVVSYRTYVPWLRGLGYRVWAKPSSPAATGCADLLLQD